MPFSGPVGGCVRSPFICARTQHERVGGAPLCDDHDPQVEIRDLKAIRFSLPGRLIYSIVEVK
ncbi:MAG: hypothetical protein V2G42_07865 [bacterium JZ-2024 1]